MHTVVYYGWLQLALHFALPFYDMHAMDSKLKL